MAGIVGIVGRGREAFRVLLAVLLLASLALVGAAAPAVAAHSCSTAANGVANVHLDDSGDRIVLKMKSNKLYVNGVSCGSPIHVFIQDTGLSVTSDDVVFDLTRPFRANGKQVTVQLNLKSHMADDTITIRGAKTRDIVELGTDFIWMKAPTEYAPHDPFRLRVTLPHAAGINLMVELRGGNDDFRMTTNFSGLAFPGKVKVEGGSGKDKLRGSLGKQVLKGGSGKDLLVGKEGRDRLFGNGGDDKFSGGKGGDFIHGGSGADDAAGGSGSDKFDMEDGNVDIVDGGPGTNDSCTCDADDVTTGLP
ncbi:MAG: hypothetical protein GY720_22660 [bacterium]|nr:hypothetical protein [bacterium]